MCVCVWVVPAFASGEYCHRPRDALEIGNDETNLLGVRHLLCSLLVLIFYLLVQTAIDVSFIASPNSDVSSYELWWKGKNID